MIRCTSLLLIATVAFLTTQAAQADPATSDTYKHAKAAYDDEDYGNAGKLMRQYLTEDRKFLGKHPEVARYVRNALSYCNSVAPSESLASVSDALDADELASAPKSKPAPRPPRPPLP